MKYAVKMDSDATMKIGWGIQKLMVGGGGTHRHRHTDSIEIA
jgi:hypothetical protein